MPSTQTQPDKLAVSGLIPAVVTGAIASCAAMFVIAYVLHLPGLSVPAPLVGALMLAALGGVLFITARLSGTANAVRTGGLAGAGAAVISLIAMGSVAAEAFETSGAAHAAMMLGGWFLFVTAVGLGAGAAGRTGAPAAGRAPQDWLWHLAAVVTASTVVLLAFGGLVTSAQAGLAVPDWPATNGANMFLYPLSKMTGGVFYEHAHRLMGAFVGFSTLVLMVMCLTSRRGRLLKAAAVAAFLLVSLQGILGGLRVSNTSTLLAIVHGIEAHLVLSVLALVTLMATNPWRDAEVVRTPLAGKLRQFAAAACAIVFFQIILGAVARHIPDSLHGVFTHAGFSLFAASAALTAGALASKHAGSAIHRKLGKATMHTVGLQMVLGITALGVVMMTRDAPEPTTLDLIITTAHQVVGALLLALLVMLTAWSFRTLRPA